ncbi:MAG: hypothetical protein KC457_05930 [Myxococcales bacterium]|nr:hypothetical protein [Myxococcales bacterium]
MDALLYWAYFGAVEGARELAWAVTRAGHRPAQVSEDFKALAQELRGGWDALFPRRLGYATRTVADDDGALRLVVRRGDFEGQVELCCDRDHGQTLRIRALAEAHSLREQETRAAGQRIARRIHSMTMAGGATLALIIMGLSFTWVAGGFDMPLVGGLMLTVIISCVMIGASTIGGRMGEALARRAAEQIERELRQDPAVQADIKRWNSLSRQLRGHRRALARGLSGTPFRREAQ